MKERRPQFSALRRIALVVLFISLNGVMSYAVAADPAIYDGLSVGFTDEGYPYIGEPDAPVTLEEWSDYLCPYCGRHFRQTHPQLLDEYVREGQVQLVFRDLPLASLHPTAAIGHVAANCAGEQGAATYWAMHDALFARQGEWSRLPDPSAFLAGLAEEVGVDKDAYTACTAEGAAAARVASSVEEGRVLGYKGNPDAKLVVVEFNDFECPPCQQHSKDVQPQIDEELVDTWEILWVDKHFPLRMHEHALIAAVAAECAGAQQRYWNMHPLLHADSERWANDDAEDALVALAESLKLDMQAFRRCFDSREGLERVVRDLYDAQGVITRAPTFVISHDGRGSTTGPLPGESFVKLLKGRLEKIESADQEPEN